MSPLEDDLSPRAGPDPAPENQHPAGTAAAPGAAPAQHPKAVPDDLRTPWSWLHVLLFLLFALSSLVALDLAFAGYAIIRFHLSQAELLKMATTNAAYVAARQTLWFAGCMLFLLAITRLHFGFPFWRTIGWKPLRPRDMTPLGAAVAFLFGGGALAIAISILAAKVVRTNVKMPIQELLRDRQSVLLLMTLAILLAPVVEETIFRGFLYPVLARSFGRPAGVLATGALFGLMHAGQLGNAWGFVALLILVGVVLTYARARTGTVLASFLLHLGYNTMLFVSFYIGTHGLRNFPASP